MGMLEEMEALSIKEQPGIRLTRLADQIKTSPCPQGDDSNYSKITGSQIQLPAIGIPTIRSDSIVDASDGDHLQQPSVSEE
ncbi:hypothetical protein PR202_gb13312 [Eleusine coracana subsp. coracana]|uniref:Uncharacterized protein n=1 Tax=Eleusine coracana subsp. coracana TaxID=191504 RepID=A0AAV5ESC6_ELECO|nr:hypothetical protein PR202_gb13312 [Eleusine coracana subsp. coracana]